MLKAFDSGKKLSSFMIGESQSLNGGSMQFSVKYYLV
jgi:hypothetical protein